jgi:hypothetical protein
MTAARRFRRGSTSQPLTIFFGRMRETAVIAVAVAVGFWFFGVWSGT